MDAEEWSGRVTEALAEAWKIENPTNRPCADLASGSGGGRSIADLLVTLQELEHLGVGFVSLTVELDLTTAAGRAMTAISQCLPPSSGRSCRNGPRPAWRMPD